MKLYKKKPLADTIVCLSPKSASAYLHSQAQTCAWLPVPSLALTEAIDCVIEAFRNPV